MRILIINYEFPPLGGGGGVACYNLAREFAKTHEVDYITTGFKGLKTYETVDGINVYRVPVIDRKELNTASLISMVTFFPSSLIKGITMCLTKKYDVISAHFVIPSGPSGVILSKLFRIPLAMSLYGGDVYDPTKTLSPHNKFYLRPLITWLLNNSRQVIAESKNIMENTIKYYQPKKAISIVPVGFVKPDVKHVERTVLGIDDNILLIVSVGRLIKRKGFDTAIKAVARTSHPNLHYIIIGDGPEEKLLCDLISDLHQEGRITLAGFVSEEKKYQYLANADVYLLSSVHEGFGICLMEAMYAGLPIVTTNNGGQTDFLSEGRNAYFVPAGDVAVMSRRLSDLIDDRDSRGRLAMNNGKDIQMYSIEQIAREYEHILFGV